MNKWVWIGYGMMWLSVALAVSVGIYFTHSIHCLWFLLIPSCVSFSENKENKDAETIREASESEE